ncbi:HI1506-related protein [Agrobacterium tumefaciens]|uniref:HI1506-related protein n=1 Tax=Agrobacterium tumefaciens TaxID=358 RepID=UPI003BA2DD4E
MSKPTTSPKKSRSTAPAVDLETVKTDGTQDDAAVTTSAASDPSGLRAPDGNNTGPADADGSVADQNLTGEGHAKTDADAATASVNLSTEPSQGDAGGAGANAGSETDTMAGAVNSLLIASGAATVEQLLHLSSLGRQFRETLHELVHEGLVSEFYMGSTTPVDAFRDLAEKQRLVPAPPASELFADLEMNALADQVGEHADRYASMDREQFERDFPLSFALLSSFTEQFSMEYPPLVRITSKRDGFRRAGIAHSSKPVDYRPAELSPEQLEVILAEPLLTVEVID